MGSRTDTAKLLENSQMLKRQRWLKVLEKTDLTCKLDIVLGDKRLTDRVVKLF